MNNKFFLYARKSTDEPDRQILSIEAQIHELKEFAEREHLEIVDTFIESQTAKEPGRPIFNNMLSQIEKGKASGIVAWHPDRLARNSVDGGRVIYLVDTGKIIALKFPTFWFDATPQGKFMLSIAFGQSKYYIDNLSENVKRGLRQKVRRGEQSGHAPTGYLNDKANHVIVPDPARFKLVRELFEAYATGSHSLKEVRNLLSARGLVSRNGKVLTLSNIHMILQRPFYYGAFKFNGEIFQGKHKPAITKKLFDQCQAVMVRKAHPKKRSEQKHILRGCLLCGECGCSITSEVQKGHIYYRCTKKKGICREPYVREEVLASQITEYLQKVSLSSSWANTMLALLDNEQAVTTHADADFVQHLKLKIKECEEKLNRLLDAHLESTLTSEEYISKKRFLLDTKIDFEQKLKDFERNGNRWLELCRAFIKEAHQAEIVASGENLEAKRDFLLKVGSNPHLRARTLVASPKKSFAILAELPYSARSAPISDPNSEEYLTLLRDLDSNQDTRLQRAMSYH